MNHHLISTILNPRSLAVIGASRSPHKIGYQILKNVIDNQYAGNCYPINPQAKEILHLRAYPTLSHLPEVPEIAIICTPAPLVLPIITEAARVGVKAAIIITAGFSESGSKGENLQQQLALSIHNSSLRIIGPNCLGVLSTHYRLNATFGPSLPPQGSTMLISQSGALVTGILDWAKLYQFGLSHAITLGNRMDLSENDALQFAATDKHTQAIMVYVESFADAATFFSIASRLTPHKPIMLLKGGSTKSGQTASLSHTAALATNHVLVTSLAAQTGVILADSYSTWLSTALYMATTPTFTGNRISVVTNAGGPGVLVADALEHRGLTKASYSPAVTKALSKQLSLSAYGNPLDILGDAPPERYQTALSILKNNPLHDALIVMMTPQSSTLPLKAAELITSSLRAYRKPKAAVLIGGNKLAGARSYLLKNGFPVFSSPDEAVEAFTHKSRYDLQKRKIHPFPHPHASKVCPPITELSLTKLFPLLKRYGFTLPRYKMITSIDDIASALSYVGRPAVIKTAALRVLHKAKIGGVVLDVMTVNQARLAYRRLTSIANEVLFQQMVHGQVELILGAKRDSQLGPFITCGLGGSLTNALGDRAYIFVPTISSVIKQAFSETKAAQACIDQQLSLNPILSAIEQMSRLLLDHPEIAEMEINPAILSTHQLYAADFKITLQPTISPTIGI